MFQLGGRVSPHLNVVEPGSKAALHVEAGLCHPLGQDTAGNLFGDPLTQGPLIHFVGRGGNHFLQREPLLLDLPFGHGQGVLPILHVLGTGLPCHSSWGRLGISLGEFLEAKAAVPQELPGNIPGGDNLQRNIHHLQGGPMLVADEVVHKFLGCPQIVLVSGG